MPEWQISIKTKTYCYKNIHNYPQEANGIVF